MITKWLYDVIAGVNDINYGIIVECKFDISIWNYVWNGITFQRKKNHRY